MTDTEPRGRGRPSTGVRVDIRIPADLLDKIDRMANTYGMTRAEVLRGIIAENVDTWYP